MQRWILTLAATGAVAVAGAIALSGEEEAPRHRVLVELFTSQG